MQRPVMVSVDGSDKDARGIAIATAIANVADADLHVVRVIDVPSDRLVAQAETVGVDDAAVTGRRNAEIRLASLVAGAKLGAGRLVTVEVLESGDVAGAIIEHAVQKGALALVMATRAAGAVGRAIGGSIADRVVRESPLPTVVVPPHAAFMGGKHIEISRVLVPQDGSSLAFRCLEFLVELPHAKELEYVLLEVVSSDDNRAVAEARLEQSAHWLRSRGAKGAEILVATSTDAAATIIAAVRDVLPDVIAMSTRGSSGLGRLILGSVAEGVVRGSELPVLLLTPKVLAERPTRW